MDDLVCPICGEGGCDGCPVCNPPCPYCDQFDCVDAVRCRQVHEEFQRSVVASTADLAKAWSKGAEAGEPPF